MVTSTAPFPYPVYYASRIQELEPHHRLDGVIKVYQTEDSLPAEVRSASEIKDDPRELALLSPRVRPRSVCSFAAIARLELFLDPANGMQGLAMFDSYNKLIIHVAAAHFGNDESAELVRRIFKQLGIRNDVYSAIKGAAAKSKSYHAVVSREIHSTFEGVSIACPTTQVKRTWRRWQH